MKEHDRNGSMGEEKMEVLMMYLLWILFLILMVVIIGICGKNTKNIKPETGFEMVQVEQDRAKKIIANVGLQRILSEPEKRGIVTFDANQNGLIAIGNDSIQKKVIAVYNSDGVFQYGYTFISSGTFYLEFEQENLCIYFVRGDMMMKVEPSGEIVYIADILNTKQNNTYWSYLKRKNETTIDGTRYVVKNDMGVLNYLAMSHAQLAVIEENGEEHVIYDVNTFSMIKIIAVLLLVILMFAYWVKYELPKINIETGEAQKKYGTVKE